MNKQELFKELIDEAVKDNDGKWPHSRGTVLNVAGRNNSSYTPFVSFDFGATEHQDDVYWVTLCTKEEFQQRARELGFINGYRWGVEYPTNGSKPDLPDDVIIQLSAPMCRGALSVFAGSAMYAAKGATFKIIDERYKPEDTSYLDEYFAVQGIDQQKIKNTLISDIAEPDSWYCYETQKALRLPPVGEKVEVFMHWTGGWSVGWVLVVGHDADGVIWRNGSDTKSYIHSPRCEIRPLDWNRKAEAERKRVVDAAAAKFHASIMPDYSGQPFIDGLSALYDAGFLRMPEDK